MQEEALTARDGSAGDSPTVATTPEDNAGNEAVRQIGEAKIRVVVPKSVFVGAKRGGNRQQDGTNPVLRSRQETTLTTTATTTEVSLAGLIAGEELVDMVLSLVNTLLRTYQDSAFLFHMSLE